jgi:hypothetical protein
MRTFVVGDIHGRIHSLEKLLQKAGVIDKKGKRKLASTGARIVSIGDLANAVLVDINGDEECLKVAPEWFDVLLVGNHESGYVVEGMGFGGYYEAPHLKSLYNAYVRDGLVQPAMAIGNTLISHAGVVTEFAFESAPEALNRIHEVWNDRNNDDDDRITGKDAFLLRGVGRMRGGFLPYGGFLWSHWTEPKNRNFNQVVGHTTCGPELWNHKNGGHWALNIDSDVRRGQSVTGVWLDDAGQIEEIVTAKLG